MCIRDSRFTVTCTGTSTGTWISTHKFKGSSQVLLRQSSKSCKSLCRSLRSLLRVLVMLLVLLEAQQVQQEPGPLHQHRPGPGQPPLAALLGLPMSWALHPCLPGPGQAGCQGSIVESRDSNGHITGSPGNVWDASPTNIARIEVLKVGVQSLVTLILPFHPLCQLSHQICQLLLSDHTDIHAFLPRAARDVSHTGAHLGRRFFTSFPLRQVFEGYSRGAGAR